MNNLHHALIIMKLKVQNAKHVHMDLKLMCVDFKVMKEK